jgi:hypothetical protein
MTPTATQLDFNAASSPESPFIVNRYGRKESAELVRERAQAILEDSGANDLKVRQLEVDGEPIVVVLGFPGPKDSVLRSRLADLFVIGEPIEPDERVLRQLRET